MRSALFSGFTERGMAVSYRRLGTTYRSHLQGSGSPRRAVTKERKSQLHRGASLKSRIVQNQFYITNNITI
jgi:hypothetical protein